MCSGVEPTEALSGAPFVQESLSATLGAFGPVFITVAMVLFAFTTLLGNLFYVDKAFYHVLGRAPSKSFTHAYYVIASALIFLGAGLSAGLLWDVADLMMGLMTLINLPVIAILGRYAYRALANYKKQKNEGKEPTFCARDVGIKEELDYWN